MTTLPGAAESMVSAAAGPADSAHALVDRLSRNTIHNRTNPTTPGTSAGVQRWAETAPNSLPPTVVTVVSSAAITIFGC